MRTYGLPSFLLLLLASVITAACGSPSSSRFLQSVTVSPASADAQNYPNGQVTFTATGYYSMQPSPVNPLTTQWGVCFQDAETTAVTINPKTGTAQCIAGSAGTYTIFTLNVGGPSGSTCNVTSACGGGCFITGTAQLTCP
jgi:hypothetical protein